MCYKAIGFRSRLFIKICCRMKGLLIMKRIREFIDNMWKLIKCVLKCCMEMPYRKELKWPELVTNNLLIVGNGPSTAGFSLNRIVEQKNIDICVVNYFPLKDKRFLEIKPRYVALVDPAFYAKNGVDISKQTQELFDVLENVDWDIYIISRLGQNIPVKNKRIHHIYLTNNVYEGNYFRKFFYQKNMACFAPQNVVLAGMFYAITKGVKNIYLIGVEMDFFKKITVTGQNNVALESIHHYGKEHYTYSQNRFKISEFFWSIYNTFRQFDIASEYAKEMKSNVINLTHDSMLDMFKKEYDLFL